MIILLFAWIDYSPARLGDYEFPPWADGLGWMMSFASVIWILIIAIYKLVRADQGNILQVGRSTVSKLY